jgi:hypothetical protein
VQATKQYRGSGDNTSVIFSSPWFEVSDHLQASAFFIRAEVPLLSLNKASWFNALSGGFRDKNSSSLLLKSNSKRSLLIFRHKVIKIENKEYCPHKDLNVLYYAFIIPANFMIKV